MAGVTVAGAAAIAVNPVMSNITTEVAHNAAAAEMAIQHREVQLTSGVGDVLGDYESVLSQTGANLQTLGSDAAVAIPAMLRAMGANLSGYGSLLNTALTGTETSLKNALYGGWYGGDDGYVFGLLGGSVTSKTGVTESGSTLQEVFNSLKQGNVFNAFSYLEEWSLEVLDHTLKPLLSPFLNTAKAGATATATIPGEILSTLQNVTSSFLSYSTLKTLAGTLMSPALSVAFGMLGDLSKIAKDVTTAKIGTAVTDALKVPADLVGDLLNGYVYVNASTNPTNKPFTGLLNAGSLLQTLLVTWPKQLATALGVTGSTSTAATTTAAVTAAAAKTVAAPATAAAATDTTAKSGAATESGATTTGDDTKAATSAKKQDRHSKQAKGGDRTASTDADSTAGTTADSDTAAGSSVTKQDHHGKTKQAAGTDDQAAGDAQPAKSTHSDGKAKHSGGNAKGAGSHSSSHGSKGSSGSGHK